MTLRISSDAAKKLNMCDSESDDARYPDNWNLRLANVLFNFKIQ